MTGSSNQAQEDKSMRTIMLSVCAALVAATSASAQVGKSLGVVDANTIAEAELVKVPHITPAVAKAIVAARPFQSIVELNTLLGGQGLTDQQRREVYGRVFVHINLNTATAEEIMLIPGAGKRMAHEFEEYRPWKAWAQFDKEIGKYVNAQEVARLAQYGFIPLNLNTASDADLLTIPGVGQRMLREFKEYRPWKTREQFDREIGKYVDRKEVGRLARYVAIP
jgi:DNA uptake protein ComE-like DNA-binding protein